MILPFSTSRSRTSLISKPLYWASLTPRAMFSKSMNRASLRSSLRSSFIGDVPSLSYGGVNSLQRRGTLNLTHPLYARRQRFETRFLDDGEQTYCEAGRISCHSTQVAYTSRVPSLLGRTTTLTSWHPCRNRPRAASWTRKYMESSLRGGGGSSGRAGGGHAPAA